MRGPAIVLGLLLAIPASAAPKTFTFRLTGEPETLDWNRAHTPVENYLLMNLMEGLVAFDSKMNVVPALAKRGIGKLAVMCPAFVADCLETLEEIGMRAKADFEAAGGNELVLIPSLNAHPRWVESVDAMIRARI